MKLEWWILEVVGYRRFLEKLSRRIHQTLLESNLWHVRGFNSQRVKISFKSGVNHSWLIKRILSSASPFYFGTAVPWSFIRRELHHWYFFTDLSISHQNFQIKFPNTPLGTRVKLAAASHLQQPKIPVNFKNSEFCFYDYRICDWY